MNYYQHLLPSENLLLYRLTWK